MVVVGSINYDISVFTPRLPQPGETMIGSGHFFGAGGKGANQAVAIARLGGRVALVGRVGSDEWGAKLLAGLEVEGVDISAVGIDVEDATGIAVIEIDSNAENTIVGSPGANRNLASDHVAANKTLIAGAGVVLAQLEVPLDTVAAVAEATSGTFILNPAPAQALPNNLLSRVDILVPNRPELSLLSGIDDLGDVRAVEAAVRSFRNGVTVVTLGSEGAVLVDEDGIQSFAPLSVEAVDPTGAGDAFCGALAYSISQGRRLEEAVKFASAAGAFAASRRGAQTGMPTTADVEALLHV